MDLITPNPTTPRMYFSSAYRYYKATSLTSLPAEIMLHIASFLTLPELLTCNYVSSDFKAITRDHSLWRKLFVEVKTDSTPPCPRLCHAGVVYNDQMYVFGGHTTQGATEYFESVKQDMHCYEFEKRSWSTISEDAAKRTEHTSVVEGDNMYVFGGYSGSSYENSTMMYNFPSNTWSTLDVKGEIPPSRSAHTSIIVGRSMFVFGGWNGNHCMNDMYELKLDTLTWARVHYNLAEAPCARCSHGATAHVTEKGSPYMAVFGGYAIEGADSHPTKGYLNDIYEFHFETKKWIKPVVKGTLPSPRSRFKMVAHRNCIYMFAGWNSLVHFNNLFKYSLYNKEWEEIPANFQEEGIGQFSLIIRKDVMYLFSGYSQKIGSRTALFAFPLAPLDLPAY